MPVTIKVPNALTPFTVFSFSRELQKVPSNQEVVFDFSATTTVEPFGMLVVASEIAQWSLNRLRGGIVCRRFEHMTYAGHMGFFKSFGQDFGKQPGEALGSASYIPLTYLDNSALEADAARLGVDVRDEIEAQSKRLTATLIGKDSGEVFDTLAYALREIVRNAIEHAQTQKVGICAQYWPTKGRTEVAIVDRGIGVRSSIRANPHIDASTDKSAINYALMPAVSGKAFKGSKARQGHGPWANSGFGLYLTSRICRNGGSFFLASGDCGMLLTSGKNGKRYIEATFSGTAVRLVIYTKDLDSLRDALAKYREDGFLIQQRYREIVNIDPSSASLMLSRDFDVSLWDRLLANLRGK